VLLRRLQDVRCDVTETSLADLALGADACRLQVRDDLLDHAFAFSLPAVHLDAAETADGEFVDVQDDDMISAVTAELTGHVRGCAHMPQRIGCCRSTGSPPAAIGCLMVPA
jgi:hypothetical protein